MNYLNYDVINSQATKLNCDPLLIRSFHIVSAVLSYRGINSPIEKKEEIDNGIAHCYAYLSIDRNSEISYPGFSSLATAIENMKEFKGRYGVTSHLCDLLSSLLKD
jgi:hypothetical protein